MEITPRNHHPALITEVVLVHSSDIHVADSTAALGAVLATARGLRADVVLLAEIGYTPAEIQALVSTPAIGLRA